MIQETSSARLRKLIKMQEDEHCALVVRKHWFVFLRDVSGVFFGTLILWVFLSIGLNMMHINEGLIVFWQSAIILLGVLSAFVIWTNFWLDMWIVTNKRILHIDQITLFSRQVAATRIDRVQDVRAKISGIIETMLNFGSLQVQTAGASSASMLIRGIPNPNNVRKVILRYLDEAVSGALNHDGLGHS